MGKIVFDPTDPQVLQENRSERLHTSQERIIRDHEQMKADIKFAKKPYWTRMSEEGDYLSDGSDKQEYDNQD